MICTGPIETHYGTEYHDAREVESKENCPSCLGIFNAEILHMEAVDNYRKLNDEHSSLYNI